MNEEKAREYYVKIKTLRKHVNALTQKINDLDEQTVEIRNMINAVQQSQELRGGEDILAQLTNGVMIEATAKKPEELYLSVGAGTIVKKKPQEAIDLLEEQQGELAEYRKKLIKQRQDFATQAENIEKEAEEHIDV